MDPVSGDLLQADRGRNREPIYISRGKTCGDRLIDRQRDDPKSKGLCRVSIAVYAIGSRSSG
jgi:hypothetical protein